MRKIRISVIGGHAPSEECYELAYQFGKKAAKKGWQIVCGGLGGVMEAVSKGVSEAGGEVIGILPSEDFHSGNQHLTFSVATGLGWMRNALVVMNGDVIVAIDGSYGTLSEVSYAKIMNKMVFSLCSWNIEGVKKVGDLEELIKEIENYLNAQL